MATETENKDACVANGNHETHTYDYCNLDKPRIYFHVLE
jgi:hypothetical protein